MAELGAWIDVPPYLPASMHPSVVAAYRQGLLHSPHPVILTDLEGRILGANQHLQDLLGYDETELHGRHVLDFVAEEDRDRAVALHRPLFEGPEQLLEYEARSVRADGRVIWLRRHVFRSDHESLGGGGYVGVLEDITEQRFAQTQAATLVEVGRDLAEGAALASVAERLAELAEARWSRVSCTLTVLDETGTELVPVAHGRMPEAFFVGLGPVPVGYAGGLCGNAVAAGARLAIVDLQDDPRAMSMRPTLQRFDVVSGWAVPVIDAAGTVVGCFSLYHPVRREPTQQDWQVLEGIAGVAGLAVTAQAQRRQRELERARLRRDAITGLPNGLALTEIVTDTVEPGQPLTIAVVRVAHIAEVATALGDHTATAVLRSLFERASALGQICAVGQLAPSSFAVAAEAAWTSAEALQLQRVLSRPVRAGATEVRPDISIGFAVHTDGVADPDVLIRQAIVALPWTSGIASFEASTATDEDTRYALAGDVRRALLQREFVLHYQPKYDLQSGALVGSEALVRWQHPERGLLQPAAFLPALDLAAAGPDLAIYVARQAMRETTEREDVGLVGRVAINLNAADLKQEQVLAFFCDPDEQRWDHLDLELTETSLADDHTATALGTLAAVGYRIALDDFGTGYSSLAALQALPLSAVKIDRSFIKRLPNDSATEALIGAVSAMCKELGIQVIAEGVETKPQAERAAELGCSTGQGYLLCKPLSLKEHGYRRHEHRARGHEVVEARDDAVRLARTMAAKGASLATIAAALNARGVSTPNGRRWHTASVRRLLHERS